MLVVGITGRSGSGKSTVTHYYESLGYPIMDGDQVSREVSGPGSSCLAELVSAFGAEILNADGTLNRKLLGQLAFSQPEKTQLLMQITHPHIMAETQRRMEVARAAGAKLFFMDGAAIVGGPFQNRCDRMIVLVADLRLSVSRIILRDKISKTAAAQRLGAQLSEQALRDAADFVIENNSSHEALLEKADEVLKALLAEEAQATETQKG